MATRHYRAHQRFILKLPVNLRATQRGVRAEGETVDLGIGGGAFALDTPLRLGEAVEVEIGGVHRAVLQGEVAWIGWGDSSAVRLGVRFQSKDAGELSHLLDALGVAESA